MNLTAFKTFSYSPPDRERSEIRLLVVLPFWDPTLIIIFQLSHTSLDENARYEALSYIWGGNIGTDSIVLSDSQSLRGSSCLAE
jgi:hypothetical protein